MPATRSGSARADDRARLDAADRARLDAADRARLDSGGAARRGAARRSAGSEAERIARRHLEAHGLTIVAENYRCRMGEIDLVATEGDTLVFVEVRLRSHRGYGGAAESIDAAKQRRLVAAARHFAMRNRADCPMRFDAVLLDSLAPPTLEWRRDVITA
jgi:putative endonuclease